MIRQKIIRGSLLMAFLFASPAFPAGTPEIHMEIITEEIVGVALYSDGQTPIVDLPVRVWDSDSRTIVYRTRTDRDGIFRIPKIGAGNCYVFVGRARINLTLLAMHGDLLVQRHDIVVVMPRGMLIPASSRMMDLLIAPFIITPPDPPVVVSP